MMQLITADYYGSFIGEIAEMHRLRHRVFKGRLDWDVQTSGDMEIDDFDALHPAYLLQRADNGRIQGCVRLLPSTGPTMLRDTFSGLLDGAAAPASATIWESSRFALDIPAFTTAAPGWILASGSLKGQRRAISTSTISASARSR